MKKKIVIGCDADGVLTDLTEHNIRAGRKAFGAEPVSPDAYSLEDMFDISGIPKPLLYLKAFRIFRRYCLFEPPRESAAETIRSLADRGVEFHSVTARKFAADNNLLGAAARRWFMKWLKKYGISFKTVQFCSEANSPREKLLACRKLGVDAMIEDKPDNALYLAEHGIKVIMMKAPYNRDVSHENIIPADGWNDVLAALSSLAPTDGGDFEKLSPEQTDALDNGEKETYFRRYQRHLQDSPFDEKGFAKSDRRFRALYRMMQLPMRLYFRVKVFGKEHIPFQNGFIIACNHCDSTDQYRLGLALGCRPFVGYAAKEIEKTLRGRLFTSTGLGVFLDRNDPESRHRASQVMAVYTAHDRISLIFPEGTRKNKSPDGRARFQNRFKPGTAALAQKTGTGILPVSVNGFGRDTTVRFGEMIYVSPTDSVELKTRELERTIADMGYANISYLLKKKPNGEQLAEETVKYQKYIEEINSKGTSV